MFVEIKADQMINVGVECINLQAAVRLSKNEAGILRSGYHPGFSEKKSVYDYIHPKFNEVLQKKAAESDQKAQQIKEHLEQLRYFYQQMVKHSGVNIYLSGEMAIFAYFERVTQEIADIEARQLLKLLYGPRPRVEPIVGSDHFHTGVYLDGYQGEPDQPKDLYRRLTIGETLTMRASREVHGVYVGLKSANPALPTIEEGLYETEKIITANR